MLEKAWEDHDSRPEDVLARAEAAIGTVPDAPLAALIVHVAGEHLGRWDEGLRILGRMGDDPAVRRGQATLRLCRGDRIEARDPRVLAVAASALVQRRPDESLSLFEEALAGATAESARALAVTGNNLACALEERPSRSPSEDRLLELAAREARRFWEIAGGWLEVERAEYRLALSLLALGRPGEALDHAKACLALCRAHGADPEETRYAEEALAKVEAAILGACGSAATPSRA